MAKQKLLIIVGPTASGKTDLALTLAGQFRGEIISADSRQIYRGLDIGTAKIKGSEMRGIPHHLIDIVDINSVYTAADFKRDAESCIKEISYRDHLPIIAGGTFFYIDSLLQKAELPKVPPNPELRAELESRSTEALVAELTENDPRRAAAIDPHNRRRLIRALEIIEKLGTVPEPIVTLSPYDTLTLGVKMDPDTLKQRLEARAVAWLEEGFEDEVSRLLTQNVSRERLGEIGFEYQLGLDLVDGTLSKEAFITSFVQKNWQYIKRQMTWLQRDRSINWVAPSDKSEMELLVKNFVMN